MVSTMILFEKANLNNTRFNHTSFTNAQWAIKLGGHDGRDNVANNSGVLEINNLTLSDCGFLTDGYESGLPSQ